MQSQRRETDEPAVDSCGSKSGGECDPTRGPSGRARRRARRVGGYDVRDIGGPRGYERGDDRPNREDRAPLTSQLFNSPVPLPRFLKRRNER